MWTLTFDGATVHLPDSKGLRDLATLLGAPGRPVHAVRLLGGRPPSVGPDPVLDDRARAAYRSRLAELEAEVDQAQADHDLHRADRAQAEREALLAELSSAVGLGGRPRRLGDDTERARKAVSARIHDAITRIGRANPASAATSSRPSPPAPTAATPLPNRPAGACDGGPRRHACRAAGQPATAWSPQALSIT